MHAHFQAVLVPKCTNSSTAQVTTETMPRCPPKDLMNSTLLMRSRTHWVKFKKKVSRTSPPSMTMATLPPKLLSKMISKNLPLKKLMMWKTPTVKRRTQNVTNPNKDTDCQVVEMGD